MTTPTATEQAPEASEATIRREQLVREAVKLQAEQEAIKERLDTIKTILVTDLGSGTHEVGEHKVQVREGTRRLSSTRLTKAYPADQYPQLYKTAIDTAAVKANFAPVALEDFYDVGAATVTFK
ncbi:hypothetical protein ACFSYH_02055 [Populibacterium corticicola]|uniref:Uncharacterized protein n=1 Tax=Populibacterium corticicola TaxID=1812826 RepID=A0ABW5XBM1_9MICO